LYQVLIEEIMTKTIYNYDPQTGELIDESPADESPLEPGVILIPSFATTIKPPKTASREIAVFAEGKWHVKADWRGVPVFSTADGSAVSVSHIGKTPADVGATDKPIPGQFYAWDAGEWRLDPAKEAAQFERAKLRALDMVDQLHAQSVQALVGSPTQVEKDTWAVKLETAKAITAGASLTAEGQAFVDGAGLATSAKQAQWAARVMANAAAYARVVGVAETLRSEARVAVHAAQDEAAVQAALDAHRAATDAATAALVGGA
jgi:hypothetical protein